MRCSCSILLFSLCIVVGLKDCIATEGSIIKKELWRSQARFRPKLTIKPGKYHKKTKNYSSYMYIFNSKNSTSHPKKTVFLKQKIKKIPIYNQKHVIVSPIKSDIPKFLNKRDCSFGSYNILDPCNKSVKFSYNGTISLPLKKKKWIHHKRYTIRQPNGLTPAGGYQVRRIVATNKRYKFPALLASPPNAPVRTSTKQYHLLHLPTNFQYNRTSKNSAVDSNSNINGSFVWARNIFDNVNSTENDHFNSSTATLTNGINKNNDTLFFGSEKAPSSNNDSWFNNNTLNESNFSIITDSDNETSSSGSDANTTKESSTQTSLLDIWSTISTENNFGELAVELITEETSSSSSLSTVSLSDESTLTNSTNPEISQEEPIVDISYDSIPYPEVA